MGREVRGDEITRTALQVRLPGRTVHKLTTSRFDRELGRVYGTTCGVTLTGREEALLTTREVGCTWCNTGRLRGSHADAQLLQDAT